MKTNEFNRRMNFKSNSQDPVRRTSAQRMLTGLALASGLTAVAWSLDALPIAWISKTVAAASKSKPAASAESGKDEAEPTEKTVKLNYFSASWPRVLQDLAAAGDMDVVADKWPAGRFSRMDRAEHSPQRSDSHREPGPRKQHGFRNHRGKRQFLVLMEISKAV